MTSKHRTFYGIVCLIVGIIGGTAGTAFSLGADKQRVNDLLVTHTKEMVAMKVADDAHEKSVQKEFDRFARIIAVQMTVIQSSLADLNDTVGGLRTDVQVLKVLMERMESDIKSKTNFG